MSRPWRPEPAGQDDKFQGNHVQVDWAGARCRRKLAVHCRDARMLALAEIERRQVIAERLARCIADPATRRR